ncbi:MAG: hypothetical protein UX33_C0001G0031 [Candidatus Azambacteria bacterium GW2011_GWC1_46_13]|uniref:tRNA-specific 2-thiouridylase MnmA n=3 Tax=Candidatus Azamiibacteriota TaxID=1752741 RepID=A0A0G1QYW0_9BACT|nr:MAG: hypothetical protein UX33_C0001G0031 [Candidatus Azambacteria bacterium GW2011_GWC1_46_13]
MSGGVDSSVAALLLKQKGYDVVGVFMKNWSQNLAGGECAWARDQEDARKVAAKIGIPIYTFDFEEEYKKRVVDYMLKEYAAGKTPNPDVMCNKEIKFGLFLEKALSLGADFVATGHYVRRSPEFPISNFQFPNDTEIAENFGIENSLKIENYKLKIAKDQNKDQSYFLWTLTQEQLKHCLFPIGDYLKSEAGGAEEQKRRSIRETARKFGLPTADKKDSQGVCFIGKFDFAEFLKSRIPANPGQIKTVDGKVVGEHDGLAFYTVGQRHLKISNLKNQKSNSLPVYVSEKNIKTNTIVVAEGNDNPALFQSELTVNDIHWISGIEPSLPLKCEARIRYRQPLQFCTVNLQPITHNLQAIFDEPQRAVTSGQSIVFYRGEEMLGGGVIANFMF